MTAVAVLELAVVFLVVSFSLYALVSLNWFRTNDADDDPPEHP
jgi:hypothetical protein